MRKDFFFFSGVAEKGTVVNKKGEKRLKGTRLLEETGTKKRKKKKKATAGSSNRGSSQEKRTRFE